MGETINNIKAILDQIRPFLQRDCGDQVVRELR